MILLLATKIIDSSQCCKCRVASSGFLCRTQALPRLNVVADAKTRCQEMPVLAFNSHTA